MHREIFHSYALSCFKAYIFLFNKIFNYFCKTMVNYVFLCFVLALTPNRINFYCFNHFSCRYGIVFVTCNISLKSYIFCEGLPLLTALSITESTVSELTFFSQFLPGITDVASSLCQKNSSIKIIIFNCSKGTYQNLICAFNIIEIYQNCVIVPASYAKGTKPAFSAGLLSARVKSLFAASLKRGSSRTALL